MSLVPGTPAWLATQNDRTAFRLLLEHGPLSRSQLGELSGMSKPTAGQMIARLERAGLIAPAGEVTGSRGPNAVAYGVRADSLTGVAISILDDRIEAALVDPVDGEHPVVVLPTADHERSPQADVARAVEAAAQAAGVDRDSVSMVVIGVQAAVDAGADRLDFTDTLPGWPQTGARTLAEAATGLEVVLENDVNLATIAEGAASGLTDFTYVWLGVGLGAGLDVGGVVQRGASGSAGEIGYLEVTRSALALDPAAEDFTDLLGSKAVLALAGGDDFPSALSLLPGSEVALGALAERIVLLLEVIAAVSDPARVVLGGPTGLAGGDLLARRVQERLAAWRSLPVQAAQGREAPVLRGARRLLVSGIRERLEDAIVASSAKED
jgi:predicted NBD/HSP70 family sugar kinase